jgi:hypothetical protein
VIGGANTNIQFNNSGVLGGSSSLTWDGTTVRTPYLQSTYSVGDEGGEIQLAKPTTNSTISGVVTIDVNQNRLRFFESGGTNRGAYLDITAASASVGTNLLAGGGGTGGGSAWSTFPAYQTVDFSANTISNTNRIINQAGTVTAPSYTFINDLSLGLFDPATNVLGITTAGVERMRIGNTGNVGIGTNAPRGLLDVSGIAYARLPVTVISGTTIDLSTNFDLSTNSYFYITNSGFSNITTPASASITTARGGTFWQFKNATSSFLSVTLTNTLTLTSPVSISPSNAITLVISPSNANTLLLF